MSALEGEAGPSAELRLLDNRIALAAEKVDTSLIGPLNAEMIRNGWRRGDSEPVFRYATVPDFAADRKALRALRFPQNPIGDLLRAKRDHLILKTRLLAALGTPRFGRISADIHPLPETALLELAEETLARPSRPAPRRGSEFAQDAQRKIAATFSRLGMPWRVRRKDMVASASVIPSQRELHLKRKERFSRRFVDRLIIHEIGTHAIRAENGRLQPLRILTQGTAGYLPTEEGLAVLNEELFGLLDDRTFRTYAGRVLAVSVARRGTFSDVVEALRQYFPEQKAVTLALRAKRGMGDGGQPGGYTKDAVYLRGYDALRRFRAEGGDLSKLYVGKIGLQDLVRLHDAPWLVPPRYLPEDVLQTNAG